MRCFFFVGLTLMYCSSKTDYSYFWALRKHAYSNILKILPPKNENFQIKNADIFHTSAQNIDCGYSRVPTIYVLSRNKKNNAYPCKPQFYCIKVGFKRVKIL